MFLGFRAMIREDGGMYRLIADVNLIADWATGVEFHGYSIETTYKMTNMAISAITGLTENHIMKSEEYTLYTK